MREVGRRRAEFGMRNAEGGIHIFDFGFWTLEKMRFALCDAGYGVK
jgi:hypothetical protein